MFRFTVREVLLLTVIVALGMGWWVQWRQVEELRRWKTGAEILERVLEADGQEVEWHEECVAVTWKEASGGVNYYYDGTARIFRK